MSAPFTQAMLALSPDSFWLCGESGSTLADSVGGKNLTVAGTPDARAVVLGAPFVGVDPGINFSNAGFGSYALISSALTQIASNKFSVVGMFRNAAYPSAFVQPYFCASFSGGHTDPYYIFGYFNNSTNKIRFVIDTSGSFSPADTAYAFPAPLSWHLIGFTFDGTTATCWQDNVASTSSLTGTLHDSMGSFALNNIPALNSTSYAGAMQCASVGYWHDHCVSSVEMAALYAAAQQSPQPADPTLGMIQPIVKGRFA